MKNNLLSLILLTSLIFGFTACQQTIKKEKTSPTLPPAAQGELVVDAVGNELNSTNTDEKDLGTDNLSDLDSGFSDVQNI